MGIFGSVTFWLHCGWVRKLFINSSAYIFLPTFSMLDANCSEKYKNTTGIRQCLQNNKKLTSNITPSGSDFLFSLRLLGFEKIKTKKSQILETSENGPLPRCRPREAIPAKGCGVCGAHSACLHHHTHRPHRNPITVGFRILLPLGQWYQNYRFLSKWPEFSPDF